MKLKHPVVRGHPLHAILSDAPVALIPVAALAALADRTRAHRARGASGSAVALAAAASVAALSVGWWDWLTIPREHEARSPATLHGLINTVVTTAVVAALPQRSRRLELLAAATGLLVVSAWIGGELVYRLGWRVLPAEELELLEDAGPPHLETDRRAAVEKIRDHERADTFLPATPRAE